jgi:Domain of unknown function (DUF4041)/T5orf172 domain
MAYTSPTVLPPTSAPSPLATVPSLPGSPAAVDESDDSAKKIGIFGARKRAEELHAEVARLRTELNRLGALDISQLDQLRHQLEAQVADQRSQLAAAEKAHQARLDQLTTEQATFSKEQLAETQAQLSVAHVELSELQTQVAVTREEAVLQEVGIYQYRHPLTDALAYKAELARLQDSIKAMATRDGGAVSATTTWTVNGSAAQGRSMVREYSKLMLRAYNAEADNLVRSLRPYKLATAIDRLNKVALTIERLGKTMSIKISDPFHKLRIRELELTADFLEKQAEEREREREEKARLREERQAQLEIQRERERLVRERQHHLNALAALVARGDAEGAERLKLQLQDVDKAIADVDYRAANIRAGYVYVISNVGSFGPNVVKVGMTRRLDPRDRVRELSDASVPFNFDVHALFFSADAVGIETKMHQLLVDRRVNRVNSRREFFYATPAEAEQHLKTLAGEILEFIELPEALEYRQSETERERAAGSQGRHHAPAAETELKRQADG